MLTAFIRAISNVWMNDKAERENVVCLGRRWHRRWHSRLDFSYLQYMSGSQLSISFTKSLMIPSAGLYPSCANPSKSLLGDNKQAVPEVTEVALCEERKNPAIKAELIGVFEGKPSDG